MELKKLMAIIAVLSVLSVGTLTPKRAHAIDTAIIVVASVVAYVAVIATAAYFIFRKPPSSPPQPEQFMPAGTSMTRRGPDDGVRFAQRCRQDSGNVTLACW